MRFGLAAAIAAAALAACATEEHYDRMLDGWVGQHVDSVIVRWGPPDKSASLSDGRRVIEYDRERTLTSGGYTHYEEVTTADGKDTVLVPIAEPDRTTRLSCETRFVVAADGIVQSWSHDGDDCVAPPPE